MSTEDKSSGGISVCGLLGVAFVVLRLCGLIGWSWWWVTLPFWGPFAVVLAMVMVVVGITALGGLCARLFTDKGGGR